MWQAIARIKKRAALGSQSPKICDSWDWLPEGILREITVRLDLCSVKAARLVCNRFSSLTAGWTRLVQS